MVIFNTASLLTQRLNSDSQVPSLVGKPRIQPALVAFKRAPACNLVNNVESRLVSLVQNFDLGGIYVIDHTVIPLHAYEMAS